MTSKRDGGGSSQPVSTATGQPTGTISAPTKPTPTTSGRSISGDVTEKHSLVINGVHITANADGSFDLPGGIHVPKGAKIMPGAIEVGGGQSFQFRDGKIFERRQSQDAGIDFGSSHTSTSSGQTTWKPIGVHGSTFVERPVTTPAAETSSLAASDSGMTHHAPAATPQPRSQAGALAGSDFAAGASMKSILDLGTSFIGTPYVWGGEAPGGFDCSGLLQYIYAKNGIQIPRVANDQINAGTRVAAKDAQPGDLIGFDNDPNKPGIDHIGIYLGNGKMLQAPHTGSSVQIVNVNLAGATAISRVAPPSAYAGLPKIGNHYVYQASTTPGATSPHAITPAAGGGDPGTGASAPVGTGPGGAMTSGDPTPALPPNATPAQIQTYVEQYYPDIVPYLHDKEIGPILLQAAQGGWSDARLQGAVQKTDFWKTHSQTQRAWDLLNTTDRATAHSQVQSQMAQVQQIIQQSGQHLDAFQIHDIAVRSLRNGYSGDQLKADIAAHSNITVGASGAPTGQAAVTLDSLKQQASQYLVPVSAQTLQTWVNQISNGQVPAAAFDSYLKEQAKSLFPGMTAAIDSGVTPTQYTDPYKQIAAQTLEVPPDSVNFSDPKWSKALFQVDPKTGARTSMSLADWGKTLRSDPIYGYGKTAGAKTQAADFAEQILQTFGAIGNYGGNG